jgi:hypothetical protein
MAIYIRRREFMVALGSATAWPREYAARIHHAARRRGCDVAARGARASDDLIKEGKLARRVDIARSSIGIAVRAGAS